MSDTLVQVTDQEFSDTVLQSDKPVVVDFWAPWCRPCLMMAPTFEELAGEYKNKMVFAKMNTDENQMTPGGYGVQGIPTLIFFRNGQEVDRIVGLERAEVLRRHIDAALNATV
jgi:thioredoxin 1